MKPITLGDIAISSIIERDGPWRRPAAMFPTCDAGGAAAHLRAVEPVLNAPAAAQLGMPLLDTASRGSQIADEAGFFIACGIIIILGVVSLQRQWLYAGALLVGVAGVARVLATLLHDAVMEPSSMAIEVIVPAILLTAAVRLCR